jgi:hypothetical protein
VIAEVWDAYRSGGMDTINELLHNEIARLRAERSGVMRQKSELIAWIDSQIAHIDQQLSAAEKMLAVYQGTAAGPDVHEAGISRQSIEPTWMDIDATEIPTHLKGRQLRSHSKRATIIRATKAFLNARGSANRAEIFQFLKKLEILGKERQPTIYLSVTLSNAKEIFAREGMRWRLREGDQS